MKACGSKSDDWPSSTGERTGDIRIMPAFSKFSADLLSLI